MEYEAPAPTSAMWFIIATCVVWLGYEIYVIYYKKETISTGFTNLMKKHPIIIFMIGVLFGHWLW
jgi:hypothetical protein